MEHNSSLLSNGIRVVSENHPHSQAISVGIWICTGTRDEDLPIQGMSHLLEHMVFKGTKKRSAYDLVAEMEINGGEINAYTTREATCFHTLSLEKDLDLSLDLLSDVVCNAEFPPEEFEKEKQVVLQEIAMYEEMYEEFILDEFFRYCFSDSMGWNILGTQKSVSNINREAMQSYYKKHYQPGNLMVSLAGNVDHKNACELAEKYLGQLSNQSQLKNRKPPKFKVFNESIIKDIEQYHILFGFNAPSITDNNRYAAYLVNTLMGGGMASRLYQTIREKEGLAYSVYSSYQPHTDCGVGLMYAATDPAQAQKVVELMDAEVKKLRLGISQKELDQFKNQCVGYFRIYADDIESRMNSLGLAQMVFGKYVSVEDGVRALQSVDLESINSYIYEYFDLSKFSLMTLGKNKVSWQG